MLRPSKKVLFAIAAVLDIAYHSGGEPVQSRDITRRQGIPRRYLEQTLQQLVRSGILIGVRGPRGGYRLARERRRISIGDIVAVVQAMEAPDPADLDPLQSPLGQKIVRPMWETLSADVLSTLNATSIDDLCRQAWANGVDSEAEVTLDFTI